MRHPVTCRTIAVLALAAGCRAGGTSSDSEPGVSTYHDADSDEVDASTWPMTSTTKDPNATSSGSGDDLPIGDVFTDPGAPDFGAGDSDWCAGKIDMLVIFERDGSMWDQQEAIEAAIPAYREIIETELDKYDLHIMVVVVDHPTWGMPCEDYCAASNGGSCAPYGPDDYPCWAYEQGMLNACDKTFGAGSTFPAAFGATNDRCALAGGHRYVTGVEADVGAAFECIARQGIVNANGAYPPDAMLTALSPEFTLYPDGCNLGFLRDDALLFLINIGDNGHGGSEGTAEEWLEELLDHTDKTVEQIVASFILPDGYEPDGICDGPHMGPYVPPLNKFLKALPHGFWASTCGDDFVTPFELASARARLLCPLKIPD